jgi:cytochrome c2
MKGWQQFWRQLSLFGLLALVLTGCGKDELSTLKPSGPVAAMQFDLMKLSFVIMIGVFIVVMLIFTYVLIRYRKRPGQQGIPKQVEGNHAFWIPALGGKIDTNPGQENPIWLQADKTGIFYGKCAELCGASHALMDFKVEVMDQAAFDSWANGMKGVQSKEPVAATSAGAAQGQEIFNKSCLGCHAIAGKGGKMGPNLTNFADRERVAGILAHTPENIAEWLKDPQKVKPGNNMPNLNLDDAQVKALVEYMSTLSVKDAK